MNSSRIEFFRIIIFFIIVFLVVVFSLNFSNWGSNFSKQNSYSLHANFEDIGNLRVGSPVKIAGVLVGSVYAIKLNKDYQAEVVMQIRNTVAVPDDSSIRVVTQGLLGGNYLSLTPGLSNKNMRPYSNIEISHSAFVLEDFINKTVASLNQK